MPEITSRHKTLEENIVTSISQAEALKLLADRINILLKANEKGHFLSEDKVKFLEEYKKNAEDYAAVVTQFPADVLRVEKDENGNTIPLIERIAKNEEDFTKHSIDMLAEVQNKRPALAHMMINFDDLNAIVVTELSKKKLPEAATKAIQGDSQSVDNSARLGMSSLYIKSVQVISNRKDLFERVMKKTPDTSPHHSATQERYKSFGSMGLALNEQKRRAELATTLDSLEVIRKGREPSAGQGKGKKIGPQEQMEKCAAIIKSIDSQRVEMLEKISQMTDPEDQKQAKEMGLAVMETIVSNAREIYLDASNKQAKKIGKDFATLFHNLNEDIKANPEAAAARIDDAIKVQKQGKQNPNEDPGVKFLTAYRQQVDNIVKPIPISPKASAVTPGEPAAATPSAASAAPSQPQGAPAKSRFPDRAPPPPPTTKPPEPPKPEGRLLAYAKHQINIGKFDIGTYAEHAKKDYGLSTTGEIAVTAALMAIKKDPSDAKQIITTSIEIREKNRSLTGRLMSRVTGKPDPTIQALKDLQKVADAMQNKAVAQNRPKRQGPNATTATLMGRFGQSSKRQYHQAVVNAKILNAHQTLDKENLATLAEVARHPNLAAIDGLNEQQVRKIATQIFEERVIMRPGETAENFQETIENASDKQLEATKELLEQSMTKLEQPEGATAQAIQSQIQTIDETMSQRNEQTRDYEPPRPD